MYAGRILLKCLTRNFLPFPLVLYPVLEAKGVRLYSKPVLGSTTAHVWYAKKKKTTQKPHTDYNHFKYFVKFTTVYQLQLSQIKT